MKTQRLQLFFSLIVLTLAISLAAFGQGNGNGGGGGGGGGGGDSTAGNNLSYPVIWADADYTKVLRGTPAMTPITGGAWWWWWGVIEGSEGTADVPLACAPDPDNNAFCDDGITGMATGDVPGDGYPAEDLRKAYLQKELQSTWQAGTLAAVGDVNIEWIDWGDDLESKDWTLKSQVRIEHVINEAVEAPMLQYVMRHVSGWGTDEVHGLSVNPTGPVVETLDNYLPTIFSACARLTLQRLTIARDDTRVNELIWDPVTHQWTGAFINAPILNSAVYEAADGPGYYNAEVNVKGKIIYGYTWGVRKLNQGAGDYRITFSFDDDAACPALANTFITTETQIYLPIEESLFALEEEPVDAGGIGVLVPASNLTYMDVRILPSGGGGGRRPR